MSDIDEYHSGKTKCLLWSGTYSQRDGKDPG